MQLKTCAKCQSDKVVPNAMVIEQNQNSDVELNLAVDRSPDAFIFKNRLRSTLAAKVCGDCGFVELYADYPGDLFQAYLDSNK